MKRARPILSFQDSCTLEVKAAVVGVSHADATMHLDQFIRDEMQRVASAGFGEANGLRDLVPIEFAKACFFQRIKGRDHA